MQRRTSLSIALTVALAAGAMFGTNVLVANWHDGLTAAAESGDPRAMRQLGEALLIGSGREANTEEGLAWLQQAADKDDAVAHYTLYRHFAKEARTPAERELRHKHLRRAAALGHTGAITSMGQLYLSRAVDPQLNPSDAASARDAGLQLIERAAEAGNPNAANLLGDLYLTGQHVPADRAKAIAAFERADDGRGHFRLYTLHIESQSKGNTDSIKRAYAHLHQAGSKGHPEALALIIKAYEEGKVVTRNLEMAEGWAAFAIESGVRSAAVDQLRIADLRHNEALIAADAEQAKAKAQASAAALVAAETTEVSKDTPASKSDAKPAPAETAVVATVAAVPAEPTPVDAETVNLFMPIEIDTPAITIAAIELPTVELTADVGKKPSRMKADAPASILDASAALDSRVGMSGESLTFANLPTIEDLSARLDQLQQHNDALDMEVKGLRAELDKRNIEGTKLLAERDDALSRIDKLERQLAGLRGDNAPRATGVDPAKLAKAVAPDHEEINRRALAAFERRDYVAAIKHFSEAADLGNASAMNNLAMMHARGYGVTTSIEEAITHFERAAATGSDVAATNLAHLYHYGRGIRVDHQRAITWYKRARDLGNTAAQGQIDQLTRADRMLALAAN